MEVISIMAFGILLLVNIKNNRKRIITVDGWDKAELVNYMEALLHMELNNYVERIEGGVTIGENVEIAMIKVKISAENENTVTGLLENKFINLGKNDTDEIPPFPSDSLLSEIKAKEWKNTFLYVVEGRRAKTREIYIYVTLDKTGMYLYFWG